MALEPDDPRHNGIRRYGSVDALSVRVLGRRLALTVAISLLVSTEFHFQPLPAGTAWLGHDLWQWPRHALECLWMGLAMMLALTSAEVTARGWPAERAFALYVTALLAGAFLGASVLIVVHGLGWGSLHARRFWADVCFWIAVGHGTATIHFLQRRASRTADELHRLEARRIALGRENLEARLALMRAQIEPHFLFNALANVKRLCRDDVDAGTTMLRNLSRYLRAAWPQLHDAQSTLAREAELVGAYFAILEVRMGARLRHVIDIPAELARHPFPSMMLLTLAENAIKHGLAPTPKGGTVVVRARATPDRLEVSVADDGVGLAAMPAGGRGIGLANTRARLGALFGSAGSLALASNVPSGVVATLRLPLQGRDAAHVTEARR
jgi:signal transduction histidine kinase